MVAIIGGAKVSDKIGVLEKLTEKVDKLIIGGGMAFTFLRALGFEVGKSLCEQDMLDVAKTIMAKAEERHVRLYLPVDCVVAQAASVDAVTKRVTVQEIPKEWMALDIGPASTTLFGEALDDAKTIVWNGPMGMFELAPFSRGTFGLVDLCRIRPCPQHRGRRGHGYRRASGGSGGQDILHIDRRRRFSRAARRKEHARGGCLRDLRR